MRECLFDDNDSFTLKRLKSFVDMWASAYGEDAVVEIMVRYGDDQ